MAVICKLSCGAIEDFGGTSKRITLNAVYPNDQEREAQGENASFNNATPYAEFKMNIDNPNASVRFEQGKQYYCVFYPAEIGMAAALNGGSEPE
jgi:hypothetical protein